MQSLATTSVNIFIYTNPFKKDRPCINLSKTIGMSLPISDPALIIPLCAKLLKQIYEPGYHFYKGGVILGNLTADQSQNDLFNPATTSKSNNLSQHHLLRYASELGNDRWLPRAKFQSNRFTTHWNELLCV